MKKGKIWLSRISGHSGVKVLPDEREIKDYAPQNLKSISKKEKAPSWEAFSSEREDLNARSPRPE